MKKNNLNVVLLDMIVLGYVSRHNLCLSFAVKNVTSWCAIGDIFRVSPPPSLYI